MPMWRHYFGEHCRVHGVDIREECKMYEDAHTTIHIGDQADRAFWKRFRESVPAVDVLIDDGGHQPEQQMVTLEEMSPTSGLEAFTSAKTSAGSAIHSPCSLIRLQTN